MKHIVYFYQIAPKNEEDFDNNGGVFDCPICESEQYIAQPKDGENYFCSCGAKLVFDCDDLRS